MYMTPFMCTVTNPSTAVTALGKPRAPQRCDGEGHDEATKAQKGKCVKGAKSPMYWRNKERMNMLEPGHWAPTYNAKYGFVDGAQEDIDVDGFVDENGGGVSQVQTPEKVDSEEDMEQPSATVTAPPEGCPQPTATVTVTVRDRRRYGRGPAGRW